MEMINGMEILNEVPEVTNGKVMARDWTMIPYGNCIECKKPITDYSTKYFGRTSLGMAFLYDKEHGYCEECAKKSEGYKGFSVPVMEKESIGLHGKKQYFKDGSSLEDENWNSLPVVSGMNW